jgi:hypothetical protein
MLTMFVVCPFPIGRSHQKFAGGYDNHFRGAVEIVENLAKNETA